MKILTSQRPTDPEQLGSIAAIERAALRARELARQTNTPCYVLRDGRVVDIAQEDRNSGRDINRDNARQE